jgi:hypothetical protein
MNLIQKLKGTAKMGVSDEDCLMLDAADRIEKLEAALKRISKHDKIILGEHMDQVRQIAREALE